jgi:hypothetical protein
MVRAGVVDHPKDWAFGGYNEIQEPKQRYAIIDPVMLCHLLGIPDQEMMAETLREWVEDSLSKNVSHREIKWTESIAVGNEAFVTETKKSLGAMAVGRSAVGSDAEFQLRESLEPYNTLFAPEKGILRAENRHPWNVKSTKTTM